MTNDLEALCGRVQSVFAEIHRRVFLGDPAANPRLGVEVRGPLVVADTPTVVLITPWTLNGLTFPPDGALADTLVIGERQLPVFANEVAGLGPYQSVNLAPDVSHLASPQAARDLAETLIEPFREAVARARRPAPVAEPSRRRLLAPWTARP